MVALSVGLFLALVLVSIGWALAGRDKRQSRRAYEDEALRLLDVTATSDRLAQDLAAAHRDLDAVRGELQQAISVRSEVLANVSHELRTPLTSICGYVELLQQRTTDANAQELLSRVARNAEALVVLINKILDLSRLKAGRLEMTIAPVPVEECLEAAYVSIEPQLLAKRLHFERHFPDQPVLVVGSFERLQQVFCNLLGNAVKFTQHGTVGVSLDITDAEARLRFYDTGVGMAPDQLDHIFEEFTQADATIRRQYGGSGLGLAISRKLVELHRGRLTVESELGQGSTFVVTLPLYKRG
jgi:signal transduction histidine kinase